MVIRGANGEVLLAAVRRMQAHGFAALPEAAAAKFGLLLARNYGFPRVEVETDALNLSKAIYSKKMGWSPLNLLVEDIWLVGNNIDSFYVSHVKRGGNTVAHLVARI